MRLVKRLPIKVLDWYLIREFCYSYIVSVLIMISLYILLDLFANINEFTAGEKGSRQVMLEILSYYWYHGFLYFAQVAGMITLVAACFTLARLQRGNELTAILSGGVSLYRVALPLMAISLVFSGFWVIDQEVIIPRIADKLVLAHAEAGGKQSFELYFLPERGNTLLSAGMYNPGTETMEQMFVMERNAEGDLVASISADRAVWDRQDRCWMLSRGERLTPETSAEFAISGGVKHEVVDSYHSDWEPNELVVRQSSAWTWFLSIGQLNTILNKPHLVADITEVQAARHVRVTQPLVNVLLMLLGLPFFLNRQPHNVLVAVGMCLFLAVLCFIFAFVSHNLASTTGHPALAAWLPLIVFGPVAASLMANIKT